MITILVASLVRVKAPKASVDAGCTDIKSGVWASPCGILKTVWEAVPLKLIWPPAESPPPAPTCKSHAVPVLTYLSPVSSSSNDALTAVSVANGLVSEDRP